MSSARLVWVTPDAEKLIVEMARVSSPANEKNHATAGRLISYLIRKRHWSPFEMANACVEIITERDIAHQILRHRSFSFQEFSQRYASVADLTTTKEIEIASRPARIRIGDSNRQGSALTDDPALVNEWNFRQQVIYAEAQMSYQWALSNNIAPEVARSVLPEGLTPTRIYMNGTIRSWIHYLDQRMHLDTQMEHRDVAVAIKNVLGLHFPIIFGASEGV